MVIIHLYAPTKKYHTFLIKKNQQKNDNPYIIYAEEILF